MGHPKEYLVTADVRQLVGQWAKRHRFTSPSSEYFNTFDARIRDAVQRAFGHDATVTMMSVDTLIEQVKSLLEDAPGLPVVMMDHAIETAAEGRQVHRYSATRLVHWDPQSASWVRDSVEGPRPNTPPLAEQCRIIAAAIAPEKKVIVVDDGCFEGDSLQRCADELAAAGVNIQQAIIGIRRLKTEHHAFAFDVRPANVFLEADFEDWVCARDYVLGVPDNGRAVSHNGTSVKELCVPYLDGFGPTHDWGSIPTEATHAFTLSMLELSRELYQEIGRVSGRPVLAKHIDRWPCLNNGQRLEADDDDLFVDCIDGVLTGLKKVA